jgi:hypothetical protein
MRKWTLVFCLAGILGQAVAQEIAVPMKDYSAEDAVFAPFVSRVRVGLRQDTVVLTWIDAEDVSGSCVVYRSTEPITKESFKYATKVGIVAYGAGRFEDTPSEKGEYYYAVLVLDVSGKPYEIFIPFKNSTVVAIEPEIPEKPKQLAAEPEKSGQPSSIAASVDGDSVRISLSSPARGHRLILYRGTEQIRDSAGILSASIVTIFEDSTKELKDYPVPGIDYYYAVVDEVNLKNSEVSLKPGENATTKAVRIASGAYRVGLPDVSPLSRSLPLPYLVVNNSISTGESIGQSISIGTPAPISSLTEKAIDNILSGIKEDEASLPEVVILDTELSAPSSGEDYTLAMIVRDTIQTKKWQDAVSQIEKFLSLHRSQETEARSRLYLGQAYAQTGMYRDALFSLLMAQDSNYAKVKPWIEYCLKALRSES